MYQMHIVAPMVKAGMPYIGVGLIYKPHGFFAGNIKRCATFLRTFFNRCESEINVAPSQAYFLQKRRGVGNFCCPMPTWIWVDSIIPCSGVISKEGADTNIQDDDHLNSLLPWNRGEDTCIHSTQVQAPQRHSISLEDSIFLLLRWGVGVGPGDQ